SGIGAGIARGLAHFGARVGCLDIAPEAVADTVKTIRDGGGEALGLVADVRNEVAVGNALAELETGLGPLYGALNCAGVHDQAPAEAMTRAQWQRLIDINLSGVFTCSQAEGRCLIRNGGGSIVNIGS